MNGYQEHALDSASAVDLVVALYDGIMRFLYAATEAVERGDAEARRNAVKRALDIIIHLQARLRMDVGGRPGAGAQRVLRLDLRADPASLAIGLHAEVRARHRMRKKRARRMAAGGSRPSGQSRAAAGELNAAQTQSAFDGAEYGAETVGGSRWNA